MIELTLIPTGRKDLLTAEHNGRVVATSRQPFYDAARALQREGHCADTPLTARHRGSGIVAMRSTVGEAAKWSVTERDRGGLRCVPWMPYSSYVRGTENELDGSDLYPTTPGTENEALENEQAA